jgi:hypothetical protein
MYEYTHGRHKCLGKCCGLGKPFTKMRRKKGERNDNKMENNGDGKAMQKKEEKQVMHITKEERR